jgi:hypothetical protein
METTRAVKNEGNTNEVECKSATRRNTLAAAVGHGTMNLCWRGPSEMCHVKVTLSLCSTKQYPIKTYGQWMYRATLSLCRHCLELSGQLVALPPWKSTRYPLDRRLGGLLSRGPKLRSVQPVVMPTELKMTYNSNV